MTGYFASSSALLATLMGNIWAFIETNAPTILGIVAGLALLGWGFYKVLGTRHQL